MMTHRSRGFISIVSLATGREVDATTRNEVTLDMYARRRLGTVTHTGTTINGRRVPNATFDVDVIDEVHKQGDRKWTDVVRRWTGVRRWLPASIRAYH